MSTKSKRNFPKLLYSDLGDMQLIDLNIYMIFYDYRLGFQPSVLKSAYLLYSSLMSVILH